MVRFAIGLLLGLSIGAASADSMLGKFMESYNTMIAVSYSARGPDGKWSLINVDEDGYVICSDEKKP